jgi:hypothetical protein
MARNIQYDEEYLQSDHWKEIRARTLRSDGYACRVCNRKDNLQVHHRSYDRLGAELPSDVITLCDDCHTIFHTTARLQPKPPVDTSNRMTLPFSALPHALRLDPNLKGKSKAICLAATLLQYAWDKPYCWPTTASLGRDMGCCENTVRSALSQLVKAGWVKVELGSYLPNCRRITLNWRTLAFATPEPVGK